MYDLIGDIHGYADELAELLGRMGYQRRGGVFRSSSRRAIFVGDFIDRGPQIREVVEIVRPMVEAEAALAVMGNHEFNALAYHTPDPERPGEHLRRHIEKNVQQHRATVEQLGPGGMAEALAWFRTLPLWLDLDGLRVVHACWDGTLAAGLAGALDARQRFTDISFLAACRKGNPTYLAVDALLKGKEARLPADKTFDDGNGRIRRDIRTRWYLPGQGHTYASYALQAEPIECSLPLAADALAACQPYPTDAKPVFVGHYWLTGNMPALLAPNVACLDYSVAKRGLLCAYRWDGEQELENARFVYVRARGL